MKGNNKFLNWLLMPYISLRDIDTLNDWVTKYMFYKHKRKNPRPKNIPLLFFFLCVSHIIHSIGNKGQKIIELLTPWIPEFPIANPEFSTNWKDSSLLVDFFVTPTRQWQKKMLKFRIRKTMRWTLHLCENKLENHLLLLNVSCRLPIRSNLNKLPAFFVCL